MENESEEILWHYTNLDGFQHIMTPGAWFYGTHYRELSDHSEAHTADNFLETYYKDEVNGMKKIFSDYTYYVGCFSRKNDSRILWDNNDIAIGFIKKEISKIIDIYNDYMALKESDKTFFTTGRNRKVFCRVLYSEQDFKEFCDKKFNEIQYTHKTLKDIFLNTKNTNLEKEIDNIKNRDSFYTVYASRILYKSDNFKDEDEERLVYFTDNTIVPEYICRKPRLKLFEINQKKMISKIIIYPKNKYRNKLNKLKNFVKKWCKYWELPDDIVELNKKL